MSVNNLAIEDVRLLLNEVHEQVTGQKSLAPVDTSSFISMAQATLAAGTDKVWGAMQVQISRTIFSVRPYTRKFKGLLADDTRWGGIIQKVSYLDSDLSQNEMVYHPVDGQSVDQWIQKKGDILVTRFVGSDAYQDWITIYDQALRDAFLSESQLGAFYAGKMQELSNKWEQYIEELNRTALVNFIAAKLDAESAFPDGVVHLLTEYNALTLQSLTITDIYQEANVGPFFRFVRSRINEIGSLMTNRSVKYQIAINGETPVRHTPLQNQKMYIAGQILRRIDTMVNTTTYHDEPLAYADVESVDYWQAIDNPMDINITPAIIDPATGIAGVASYPVYQTHIMGVIFDEDAVVTNVKEYRLESTNLNARGLYRNTWLTANSQYCNDVTEKGVVLILD